jgi:hypothetical protein
VVFGLLGALTSACQSEPGFIRVEGNSFFNPPALDYGVRGLDEGHSLTTVLRNASAERIQVQDLRFEPPQDVYAAFITGGGTLRGAVLAPNEAVEITLLYRPLAEGVYDATMVVTAGSLEIPLEITAEARLVAPARPVVSPSEIRFAPTEVGRDAVQRVRLQNGGELTGALVAVGFRAPFSVSAVGGAPLALPAAPLAPGAAVELEVHYRPGYAGLLEDRITFKLDDGEEATVRVFGDAVEPGVLSCDATVVDLGAVPRGETRRRAVRCQATGGPYAVEAVRLAAGSSGYFSMTPAQPVMTDGVLQFEVAFDAVGLEGRYDGAVEVVPLHKVRTQVALTAEVRPAPAGVADLDVELIWNTGNSDFDLHLVRHGGQPFELGKDCFFEDKNPDWGQPGYPGDDPVLTTDDVNGFGPEHVSLLYAPDGAYDLWVQFYGFDREIPPSTSVRVTYQLADQAPVARTQDLLACGVAWHVGRFTFTGGAGTFLPIDQLVMDYQGRASPECR